MQPNLGSTDRVVRGVLGCWLLAVAVSATLDDRNLEAATAAIAGTGLLANWRTGFCGGNALFDLDTTADACPEEDGPR